jgi:succinoglycan biosynthesis transport protein ExoP
MDDQQGRNSLTFGDYVRVLWRRRWLIVLTVVVAVGASVGYDFATTPIYQATAQLELTPQISSALLQANNSPANSTAATVDVPTDIQIMQSSVIATAVRKKVPNAPKVSVAEVGTTNVVNVSARSPNARLAAAAANAYASLYITVQQQQAVNALNSAEQIVQGHITAVQNQINALQQQESTTKDPTSLQAQLSPLQTQLVGFQTQISQYQSAASLNTGGGQVVGPATVPTKPADPKKVTNGVLAFVAGLIVGIGIALLLEYYDESIRSKDDLERVTNGIPTLGLIPAISDWRRTDDAYLVSRSSPMSPPAEAYRSLRTSVQFLGIDRSIRTLQFTSPNAAEGKTTTLANMAIIMAQAGQTVTVVCCDLRRPRIHEFFGLSNAVGFTSVLLETAQLSDALQPVPEVPGLHVLASGPRPPNPSELLSGPRAQAIFDQLADRADIVLIDSPPVLPVTDAVVLASQVDGVLLVTTAGESSRRDVSRTLEALSRVQAPIIGVALNRASESDSYAYYRYSYGSTYRNGFSTSSNGRTAQAPPASSSHKKRKRGNRATTLSETATSEASSASERMQ